MISSRTGMAAVSVVIVLLVAALPFVDSSHARQNGDQLTTSLTGQEVRISGPNFALDNVALEEYPHGRGERISINSMETRTIAEIAFFDDGDTPQQTIDVMLSEFDATTQRFTVLDSGVDGSINYALASFVISSDFSGYFYIEVAENVNGNIDVAQSLYAINADFIEQMTIASGEVTLDGSSFLANPVIDIGAVIAEYEALLASTPEATPAPADYSFEWIESTVHVEPPLSLDWYATTDVLESVFISSDVAYAYVGYLNADESTAESALDSIISDAPPGGEAPVLLHTEGSGERILGVYRIAIDGGFTIMVIEINATSGELWQVEALAVPQDEVLVQFEIFQKSVTIDGVGFLDDLSVDQLETILRSDQN